MTTIRNSFVYIMQSTRQVHDAFIVYVYLVFNFCIFIYFMFFLLIGDMEVRAAGRGRGGEKKLDVIVRITLYVWLWN